MLLLGLKNSTSQTALTNEVISLGTVYRKYCRKLNSIPTFSTTSNSATLQQTGIYHVTATLIGSGTAAGIVTVQLNANGTPITGALASETITTANTEQRTFVIDQYILVGSSCVLGIPSIDTQTLTLTNTGVGATFTNVVLNIDKVL